MEAGTDGTPLSGLRRRRKRKGAPRDSASKGTSAGAVRDGGDDAGAPLERDQLVPPTTCLGSRGFRGLETWLVKAFVLVVGRHAGAALISERRGGLWNSARDTGRDAWSSFETQSLWTASTLHIAGTVLTVMVLPYLAAFEPRTLARGVHGWLLLDALLAVFGVTAAALRLGRYYAEEGTPVDCVDSATTATLTHWPRRWLWKAAIDAAAAFASVAHPLVALMWVALRPTAMVAHSGSPTRVAWLVLGRWLSWLPWARMLALVRLPASFGVLQNLTGRFSSLRLAHMLFWLVFLLQLLACSWFYIGLVEGFGATSFGPPAHLETEPEGVSQRLLRWAHGLHWAFVTCGSADPQRSWHVVFHGVASVAKIAAEVVLVGQVAAVISESSARRASFAQRVESVSMYLESLPLPQHLRTSAQRYYKYAWFRNQGVHDPNLMLGDLNGTLRADILVALNGPMLCKVPFFAGAPDSFIRDLVGVLQRSLYCPGQYIVRIGEVGREMFTIMQGHVRILGAQGQTFATLKSGDTFGEVALLFADRRTANVLAVDYVETFVLHADKLYALLDDYPDVSDTINQTARAKVAEFQGIQGLDVEGPRASEARVSPARAQRRFARDVVKSDKPSNERSLDNPLSDTGDMVDDATIGDGSGAGMADSDGDSTQRSRAKSRWRKGLDFALGETRQPQRDSHHMKDVAALAALQRGQAIGHVTSKWVQDAVADAVSAGRLTPGEVGDAGVESAHKLRRRRLVVAETTTGEAGSLGTPVRVERGMASQRAGSTSSSRRAPAPSDIEDFQARRHGQASPGARQESQCSAAASTPPVLPAPWPGAEADEVMSARSARSARSTLTPTTLLPLQHASPARSGSGSAVRLLLRREKALAGSRD